MPRDTPPPSGLLPVLLMPRFDTELVPFREQGGNDSETGWFERGAPRCDTQ